MRELGDLTPIRRALAELGEREQTERKWHGDHAPTVHVLSVVQALLADAIQEALTTPRDLTLEEFAAQVGITVEAARKRWQRNQIPGAHRDVDGRIVVPVAAAESQVA